MDRFYLSARYLHRSCRRVTCKRVTCVLAYAVSASFQKINFHVFGRWMIISVIILIYGLNKVCEITNPRPFASVLS